jgi:transposase InsO family protein
MGRARGKLTPAGRLLLVQRVTVLHWPVSQAAASMGVSRETAYEWLRRWRREGAAGLEDRPSRPHRSPRQVPAAVERRILMLRRRLKWGPHRLAPLVGHPRSTIYAVLARHGLTRLRDLDRATGVPVRYVREHPGELLHLDMKPLARVPAGGGHRIWGKANVPYRRGAGYEVIHVAIDDASRLAFAQIRPDGRALTVVQFLTDAVGFFAEHGIRIQRIMTDRGWSYTQSPRFRTLARRLRIRHKITRPYRPQTNGKAERFVQTLLREWAYARLYRSNEERRIAFPKWLHYYNHHRPHTALEGRVPAVVSVNNVCGNHT